MLNEGKLVFLVEVMVVHVKVVTCVVVNFFLAIIVVASVINLKPLDTTKANLILMGSFIFAGVSTHLMVPVIVVFSNFNTPLIMNHYASSMVSIMVIGIVSVYSILNLNFIKVMVYR